MVTQQEHDEAATRGEELVRNEPGAVPAGFDPVVGRVVIDLDRGYSISFPPERVQGHEKATADELEECEIASSGLGLYFPKVDVDLWVPALAKRPLRQRPVGGFLGGGSSCSSAWDSRTAEGYGSGLGR